MYTTPEQALAAGVGSDLGSATSAVRVARALIDTYTGQTFAPTPLTVVARVGADGTALLHRRVQTVSTVRIVGSSFPLAAGAFRVLSSETPGQVDAVIVGALAAGYDVTILGAEPWNGGYAGLFGGMYATGQVEVTGVFGWVDTPPAVTDASMALARWVADGGSTVTGDPAALPDTDDEGNAVSITVDATQPATRARTTGLVHVDAMLAPYIGSPVRVS